MVPLTLRETLKATSISKETAPGKQYYFLAKHSQVPRYFLRSYEFTASFICFNHKHWTFLICFCQMHAKLFSQRNPFCSCSRCTRRLRLCNPIGSVFHSHFKASFGKPREGLIQVKYVVYLSLALTMEAVIKFIRLQLVL